jgi:hypothetical protein
MKSQRDEMILEWNTAHSPILKGWHDLRQTNDTPSGLVERRIHIYNLFTPSKLYGYGLKYGAAFQNTHLGRIARLEENIYSLLCHSERSEESLPLW